MEMHETIAKLEATDQIRASQLILLYGPGAMVPLSHRVAMTAAPEAWADGCQIIADPRLARALHVDDFQLPVPSEVSKKKSMGNRQIGVDYVSFPEWYFCPKCHRFQKLSDWMAEAVQHTKGDLLDAKRAFMKKPTCKTCKDTPLVVARLVTVCAHGHIDDFPWVEWVHLQKKGDCICAHPHLKISLKGSNRGFAGFEITCACGAHANLQSALGVDSFRQRDELLGKQVFGCKGRHPWRGMHAVNEVCALYPRALLRGASSLYYSVVKNSIVIPEPGVEEKNAIEGNGTFRIKFDTLRDNGSLSGEALTSALLKSASTIATQTGLSVPVVEKWMPDIVQALEHPEQEERYDPVRYREQEYEMLVEDAAPRTTDFYRETCPDPEGVLKKALPFLAQVVLVHKLREVRAQIGFSRLQPVSSEQDEGFVPIKQEKTKWLPAYDVRGEGIFLRFDETRLRAWEAAHPAVTERAALLSSHYAKTYFAEHQPRVITAKFLFLHSMAHLLIRALSFACGYSIASLRERIYCADGATEMAGILIYTANGDAEGTLGGLVRQGYPDALPRIFHRAIEEARFCANDPVCSLSNGQGRDALNLAACHACMLLPETSCEEFNSFLDRGVLLGTMEQPGIGFFSDPQAFSPTAPEAASHKLTSGAPSPAVMQAKEKPLKGKRSYATLVERNPGERVAPKQLLSRLSELAEDDPKAEAFLRQLQSSFAGKLPEGELGGLYALAEGGVPFDVTCRFASCHVMLFFANESESVSQAEASGWHCFSTEQGFSVAEFVKRIEQEG